jgi:hypothetical protein
MNVVNHNKFGALARKKMKKSERKERTKGEEFGKRKGAGRERKSESECARERERDRERQRETERDRETESSQRTFICCVVHNATRGIPQKSRKGAT